MKQEVQLVLGVDVRGYKKYTEVVSIITGGAQRSFV
jgi:hypothetical protein